MFRKRKKQNTWNDDEQASSLLRSSHRRSASSLDNADSEAFNKQNKKSTGPQQPPGYREVFSRQSNINLLVYSLLALHSIAFDQLIPIFMHLPTQKLTNNPEVKLPLKFAGGFGIGSSSLPLQSSPPLTDTHLDSERIGLLFTMYGICGMLIQFIIFPPVARRYGVLNCLKVCTLTFPFVYIITPFTALLPTPMTQQTAMFAIMLLKCWGVIFAFPCSTILLTNSAVSLRILGTLNGVATSISALGRAAGPAIGGTTFSLGVDAGYVIVPWWILAVFAALGAIPVWWLVEMEGFGGDGGDESENEDDDNDEYNSATEVDVDYPPRSTTHRTQTKIVNDIDDLIEEPDSFADSTIQPHPIPHLSRSKTTTNTNLAPKATDSHMYRRMTSPIGMRDGLGPGGGRRLSNNLGQTRSGWGTGGTSYA